jgi:uncharacterized membrane protein YccC
MNRDNFRVAGQFMLIFISSYLAGYYFTFFFNSTTAGIGGMWSAISAILVFQGTMGETRTAALLRLRGTLIGAIAGGLYLSFFPFNPIGTAIAIGITVLVCLLLGLPDSMRLASITVLIIMVVSNSDPELGPIANASLRFFESCIGAAIAVVVSAVWRKTSAPS